MLVNDNSLRTLLEDIKPKIANIEENRLEKSSLSNVYETIKELVELGEESYDNILNFYDQEFIIKAIKINNQDYDSIINKYQSSRYLLKSKNPSLKDLPQYEEALDYIGKLYKYLCDLYKQIKLDLDSKTDDLKVKELLNKYYIILNKNNIFIKDADEFLAFLELNQLSIEDKINILKFINKCNIKNYITTNDIIIDNDLNLSDIKLLLKSHSNLLNKEYSIDDSKLDDYLKKHLMDIESSLINRKIYLVNEINKLVLEKKYLSTRDKYFEFKKIETLESEFQKQKIKPKQLVFMFKNGKSLVRDYLENTSSKYKSCVLKNLLDLEENNTLKIPKMCYNNAYIYLREEFIVQTVYTYIDKYVLVLGVLDVKEKLEDFLEKNEYLIKTTFENLNSINYNSDERNLILGNIKIEDLVLSIDLDTLNLKVEDKNGR